MTMSPTQRIDRRQSARALAVIVLALVALCPTHAQPIDPRAPGACELPELGRMVGTLKSRVGNWGEDFGLSIHAVGDLNNDSLADWLVLHRRVDTPGFSRVAEELLLYYGRRGGLPSIEDSLRIGPSEMGSRTKFIAAGDFDLDGHRDLVLSLELFGDTSGGPLGYDRYRIVVFWGNAEGLFTLADTTQLGNPSPIWLGVTAGAVGDFDVDGVDDLLLRAGHTLENGAVIYTPFMHIFRGRQSGRWGRGSDPRESAWRWWTLPKGTDLAVIDHDGDGALDIAMWYDEDATLSQVSVLYGTRDVLPDTSNLESVAPLYANGREFAFMDLTGDRIPELVMATGSQEKLKVFVGIRGQRLIEQYGSGYDAPRPGEPRWWGRPWAEVWLPLKLSPGWAWSGFDSRFDFGDVGLDGVGDVCAYSDPWVICYNGGRILDSLVDALVYVPGGGPTGTESLGDIDGSGVSTIAVAYWDYLPFGDRYGPGGIRYVKASRCVPRSGTTRLLPQGTDTPVSIGPESEPTPLAISLVPNPAGDRALLRWPNTSGTATVAITDTRGAELKRWQIAASAGALTLDLGDWPRGAYLLTLTTSDGSSAIPLILR
jgi:hypothetical protein